MALASSGKECFPGHPVRIDPSQAKCFGIDRVVEGLWRRIFDASRRIGSDILGFDTPMSERRGLAALCLCRFESDVFALVGGLGSRSDAQEYGVRVWGTFRS